MTESPVPLHGLLDVMRVDPAPPSGAFVAAAAVGAAQYLAGHRWGREFRRMLFGAASPTSRRASWSSCGRASVPSATAGCGW